MKKNTIHPTLMTTQNCGFDPHKRFRNRSHRSNEQECMAVRGWYKKSGNETWWAESGQFLFFQDSLATAGSPTLEAKLLQHKYLSLEVPCYTL